MKKFPHAASCFLMLISFSITLSIFVKGIDFENYYLQDFSFHTESDSTALLKQAKIDVLHYDLKFDLNPENKLLAGEVTILFLIKDIKLDTIFFNFYNNLKIKQVELNGKTIEYFQSQNRLNFVNHADRDTNLIHIVYEGTPIKSGLGGFAFGKINDQSLVYNLSEPDFASSWFPCNDLPTDKALLDIYITNDSSQVSVSNGKLVDVLISGDRKTYHWKTIYPISTYLISVYSSNYKSFSDRYISQDSVDTMSIDYFVLPDHLGNAQKDLKNHSKMLNVFSKLFGEYPFIKEKYGVAEFLWQAGAMEHQTITGIGSNFVTGNNFFEDIYVHELAHQWWGNAVGLKSWKDIWLNEGFATYSEALYYEAVSGSKALKSTMLAKYQDHFKGSLYDPGENLFGTTVYDKGAWVLHMLRWEVGDQSFFKILRQYFEQYKYSNASTKDFVNICENVSGQNLDQFFTQWVFNGKDQINIKYQWNTQPENDLVMIHLNVEQIQENWNTFQFKLPVHLIYFDGTEEDKIFFVDKREQQFNFTVIQQPKNIILDDNNWLLGSFQNTNEVIE